MIMVGRDLTSTEDASARRRVVTRVLPVVEDSPRFPRAVTDDGGPTTEVEVTAERSAREAASLHTRPRDTPFGRLGTLRANRPVCLVIRARAVPNPDLARRSTTGSGMNRHDSSPNNRKR
jgi:hypothetical protein